MKSITRHKIMKYTFMLIIVFPFLAIFLFKMKVGIALTATFVVISLFVILFYADLIAIYSNFLFISGKTEQARKFLKIAIDKKTKSAIAYLNYAILLVRDGDAKGSIEFLEKANKLNADTLTEKNITLTTASSYWVLGDIDKAIEILEEMRRKYEYVNPHALITLGYMYFLKKDYDTALTVTNLALEDSPNLASAWDNLGQIYYMQNQKQEAKEAFNKALANKGDLVDSLFYLGKILKDEGDKESAKKYFDKALSCKITSLNTVSVEEIEREKASL